MANKRRKTSLQAAPAGYDALLADVVRVLEDARRAAARSVNAVMTATYWLVGRRIVEQEQGGQARAGYGEALLERLPADLTTRFGRGFSRQNLQQMRQFYLAYPRDKIRQAASGKSPGALIRQTPSGESVVVPEAATDVARAFPSVVIDLKLDEFTHADAGQMHLYLNYAREHWTMPDENPPVGLILCAKKDHAVARYALEGLPNKVLAAEYRTTLPTERILVQEIEKTRRQIEARRKTRGR